jgi:polysaccharide export outer membrane protein
MGSPDHATLTIVDYPLYDLPPEPLPPTRVLGGLHCNGDTPCRDLEWDDAWLLPWEAFAQGEYTGPARLRHVPQYRLRVDDQIEFVFRVTGQPSPAPYRINVGDTLRVDSLTDETLARTVIVQRDGTVTLSRVGRVPAAGRSLAELGDDLQERYRQFIQNPAITVSPESANTTLEELRATVDSRFGSGGQSRTTRVTPEGTVQLPAIGSVPAHGLTLAELGREINLRYAELVDGLEVTPILMQRAPRYVYVLGEVRAPGRYTLEGPTTLMQSIALAGGWNVGANTRSVIVFRRDENWQLMATKLSLHKPLYGRDPCPDGELWLRDSDIVLVPKCGILVADEIIELVFTRGVYGVVPFNSSVNFVKDLSSVAGPAVIPVP